MEETVMFKNVALWIVISFVMVTVMNQYAPQGNKNGEVLTYTQFLTEVRAGHIKSAKLIGRSIEAVTIDGKRLRSGAPRGDEERLIKKNLR